MLRFFDWTLTLAIAVAFAIGGAWLFETLWRATPAQIEAKPTATTIHDAQVAVFGAIVGFVVGVVARTLVNFAWSRAHRRKSTRT